MKRTTSLLLTLTVLLSASHLAAAPNADTKTAAQILPNTTLVYAELGDPKKLLALILDHPLRKKLEGMDQYKQFLASPQYEALQNGLAVFEKQVGMKWRDAIESTSGGGIYIAFDANTTGVALLIKATDAAKLATLRDAVVKFTEEKSRGAIQKGRTYREIETWKVAKGGFAIVGKWLVFVNNADLGKKLFDNMLDDASDSLATDKEFKAAAARNVPSSDAPTAWAFARVAGIRNLGLMNALLKDKSDNAAAELLIGGLQETLKHTPYITSALRLRNDQVRLSLGAPHDPEDVSPARGFFFSPPGKGAAPKPLKPEGTILSLTAYRDFGTMLRSADDLFEENVAAGIAQADSQLTLFFSGRPFTTEVLAAFRPEAQIIVTRPTYKDVIPAIKLPAFGIVLRTKTNDETTQTQFKTAFQTILSFVNLGGAQEGKPMLVADIDKYEGVTLLSSKYIVDEKKTDKNKADIVYNFSPSMVIAGDRIMICSTKDLAEKLMAATKQQKTDEAIPQNTLLEMDAGPVLQILKDNREHLVAQNMLEKGHTPEEALAEIDGLLDLVSYIKSLGMSMSFQDKWAAVDLDIKLSLPK